MISLIIIVAHKLLCILDLNFDKYNRFVGFINVVVVVRVLDVIVIIDFFAENAVLINDLNFSSYSAR